MRSRQNSSQPERQWEEFGIMSWLCPAFPRPLSGFFWMILWLTALAHLALRQCAHWLFFLHGMGMLCASHTPLIGWLHCCLLSFFFLHDWSTAWMIRQASVCHILAAAFKQQQIEASINKKKGLETRRRCNLMLTWLRCFLKGTTSLYCRCILFTILCSYSSRLPPQFINFMTQFPNCAVRFCTRGEEG